MIRYDSRVHIARPPADVYRGLTDAERFSSWTDMVDVEAPARPPVVGDRVRFRLAAGPIKSPLEAAYVALEPDRRVVMRIDHPWLAWTSTSDLTPTETGTELRYAGQVSLRGWRRLLEPFMAGAVRDGEHGEAVRLQALLEAATTPPADATEAALDTADVAAYPSADAHR
jgi:uncharacterized protein YndB with AHSA1/START domain